MSIFYVLSMKVWNFSLPRRSSSLSLSPYKSLSLLSLLEEISAPLSGAFHPPQNTSFPMEQAVIEELQNIYLTKEEEEEIPIIAWIRDDLLEECSLSLFGRLLLDRQQNIRALKSTLRTTWKIGSELRIVDVGSNILQFKFSSSYQRDWDENSGPWNFENNLLLLCRWKKGLIIKNIVFTHSPFWVQLWGLPFELMSEEVGQDIGRSLGRLIEVDKWACQLDPAKFMRIRVDLPIDKPLRRGGHVVSKDGEKFWIHFRFQRLPTFCFLCGMLGHNDKHCQVPTD